MTKAEKNKTKSEDKNMICMSSTKFTFVLLFTMAAGTLLGALG